MLAWGIISEGLTWDRLKASSPSGSFPGLYPGSRFSMRPLPPVFRGGGVCFESHIPGAQFSQGSTSRSWNRREPILEKLEIPGDGGIFPRGLISQGLTSDPPQASSQSLNYRGAGVPRRPIYLEAPCSRSPGLGGPPRKSYPRRPISSRVNFEKPIGGHFLKNLNFPGMGALFLRGLISRTLQRRFRRVSIL